MTQAICDITTDEVNVDVVVEPQADTMVAVANRAGGMEQVFHDNTLTGNGNSVDLGVNTEIIATKEYVDENKVDAYTKTEIDNKVTVINAEIDANADAIQKTRDDFINADSEIHQILNSHTNELTTLRGNQASLGDQVSGIEEKIPGSASAANQLVTKEDLKSIDLEGYATTDYVDTIEQEIRGDINAEDAKLQTQITAHAGAITALQNEQTATGDQIQTIESKIPDGTSDINPLINKQQLLDEEMDIREDLNEGLGELQTQITAQAAEIASKQDQLTAGDNIIISGNVISATGAGGGAGFDVIVVQELPATGQKGIIYLLAKDGAAPDVYDEYVWITATQTFELIGSTKVDLSNYLPLSGGTLTGPINFDLPYGSTILKFGNSSTAEIKTTSQGYLQLPAFTTVYSRLDVNGNIGSVWNTVTTAYIRQLSRGGNNDAKLIVPDAAGTLARLEDLENIDALPDQIGNAGKFLTTDGTTPSWSDKPLANKAAQTDSLVVQGNGVSGSKCVVIGYGSSSYGGNNNTVVGAGSQCRNNSTLIGANIQNSNTKNAVILGSGENNPGYGISVEDNSLSWVLSGVVYKLFSGDGTISADRISDLDFGTMD